MTRPLKIYGAWAGNPKGHKEDPGRCVESIWSRDAHSHGHQCRRPRGFGPGGEFCKQHDPAVRKARQAKATAKWNAKMASWLRQDKTNDALRACKAALEKIAAGYNDARSLAEETLKLFPKEED